MASRSISKASKKRLLVFGTISMCFIIGFVISLIINAYSIVNLTIGKKSLEQKYTQYQEESEGLKKDIEKLNDPEYLANYAREHYLYSTDGEYIIQIEKEKGSSKYSQTNETNVSYELNKSYLIIAIIILILVWIIFHKKRSNKK